MDFHRLRLMAHQQYLQKPEGSTQTYVNIFLNLYHYKHIALYLSSQAIDAYMIQYHSTKRMLHLYIVFYSCELLKKCIIWLRYGRNSHDRMVRTAAIQQLLIVSDLHDLQDVYYIEYGIY